jgi:hypothetical protein
MSDLVPVLKPSLTPAQFGQLADVPPEVEWLANLTNEKTKRAYKNDVAEFLHFAGLKELGFLAMPRERDIAGGTAPMLRVVKHGLIQRAPLPR